MATPLPRTRLKAIFLASADDAATALEDMKVRFEKQRENWLRSSPKRRVVTSRFRKRVAAIENAIEAARKAAAEC